jgi:hypothetical protein
MRMTLASCALRNSAPSLATAADAATSLRIVQVGAVLIKNKKNKIVQN